MSRPKPSPRDSASLSVHGFQVHIYPTSPPRRHPQPPPRNSSLRDPASKRLPALPTRLCLTIQQNRQAEQSSSSDDELSLIRPIQVEDTNQSPSYSEDGLMRNQDFYALLHFLEQNPMTISRGMLEEFIYNLHLKCTSYLIHKMENAKEGALYTVFLDALNVLREVRPRLTQREVQQHLEKANCTLLATFVATQNVQDGSGRVVPLSKEETCDSDDAPLYASADLVSNSLYAPERSARREFDRTRQATECDRAAITRPRVPSQSQLVYDVITPGQRVVVFPENPTDRPRGNTDSGLGENL